MNRILLIIAAFLCGTAGGCALAFFMGKPVHAGKPAPFVKRILPAFLGILLLVSVFVFGGALSGTARLFLTVFPAAFCISLAGTALGLEKRDPKLLELAFVFRIPVLSRIRYIDLPACKNVLAGTLCTDAVVCAVIGVLQIMMKGGAAG